MDQERKPGPLRSFFIGKGPESGCPFHKMNYRIYESVAGLFRKREPLEEERNDRHEDGKRGA